MKKALLVDDVKLFLELEKTLLKNRGIEIFTATTGKEALEIHRREHVDLILLDLIMPDLSGVDVCRIIRGDDARKKVSIIIVTTMGSDEEAARCLTAGANDVVAKPIIPAELLKKVSKFINVPLRSNTRLLVRLQTEGTTERSESFAGMTQNISSSGFLLETGQKFSVGGTATFHISLPGFSARVPVKGEIAREIKEHASEKSYAGVKMNYYGVRFTEISSELRDYLDDFVITQSVDENMRDKTSQPINPINPIKCK